MVRTSLFPYPLPGRPDFHRHPLARFAPRRLTLALALCFAPVVMAQINPSTPGLPQGGSVTAGTVTSNLSGNQLTLTQTGNRAVIDWQSFNIDPGRTVQYVQPSSSAAVLNRVSASAGLSDIGGTLSANGLVLLMNPNGVLFRSGATINVGSLIATTGTVNQTDFMAGGSFGITGVSGGSVSNQGTISAASAGLVALVAPSVSNQGVITATAGRIALSGADRATVTLNGGLYEFAVPVGALGTNATLSNAAGARLEGANLLLSTGDAANLVSGVINLQGVQQASSVITVHGSTVLLASDLNAPTVSGSSSTIQVQPGASIQDAVNIAKTGTPGAGATVNVQAGTYTEPVAANNALLILNKANLTLTGQAGAKLTVPDAAQVNGIAISANNVTVQGLEIAGPINAPYYQYYATTQNNISRGIAVGDGITGFAIRNNNIHDVRNGILIHGRNSTGSVDHNTIDNTKSGISVQYTDSSGITIAANREGTNGNEWGLNLHLNGHLDGAGNILSNTTPIATAPTAQWQQSLLALSTNNNGWGVQDQGYTAANRTQAMVATTGAAGNQGSRLTPIDTVQGGINAVVPGGTVTVAAGTYVQGTTLGISKSLTLVGAGESSTIIDGHGIASGYGMSVSADNVTLRDFTFYGPAAFYASAYGIKVSPGGGADARLLNFSISRVTSRGAGKAELDLNGVNGAVIDQVTLNGAPVGNDAGTSQGAGLQLTDSANITVRNTRTLNNAWGGVALYQANRSYNQQVNNISIDGSNQFAEVNPVYMQDESATKDFGSLNIAGFSYAVRNAATTDSAQYTWLQATQQKAYDYAVNLPSSGASYVQGWNGSGTTQNFSVGIGNLVGGGTQAMSIGAALNTASAGASIDVASGTYPEAVVVSQRHDLRFGDVTVQSLTLNAGAANSGISGKLTADSAAGLVFNAPVNLLGDTTLATLGANIALAGDVQNAGSAPRSLTLNAGSGASRGDVSMTTGGSASNPLGHLSVVSNRYSLASTLWVQGYGIDALGSVALSNHTLNALDAGSNNTLNSGGDVTGATTSKGGVALVSSGNVQVNVTADGATTVAATNISGNIVSKSAVELNGTGDVNASVTADGAAKVTAANIGGTIVSRGNVDLQGSGTVAAAVTADGTTRVSATNIGGSITSQGDVALQGSGDVSATVTGGGGATVTARNVTGSIAARDVSVTAQDTVNAAVTASNSATATGDSVHGSISAQSANVQAVKEVRVALDTVTASVQSEGTVNLSGNSTQVSIDAPHGSVNGDFGKVANAGNGVFSVNGRPELNPELGSTAENSRVNPVRPVHYETEVAAPVAVAAGPARLPSFVLQREARIERASPAAAGAVLEQGGAVEIDLSPGNERERP